MLELSKKFLFLLFVRQLIIWVQIIDGISVLKEAKERADAYCCHRSWRNGRVLWRAACQGWRGCHLPGTRDTVRGSSYTRSHCEVSPCRDVYAPGPCNERSAGDRSDRSGTVLRQNVRHQGRQRRDWPLHRAGDGRAPNPERD